MVADIVVHDASIELIGDVSADQLTVGTSLNVGHHMFGGMVNIFPGRVIIVGQDITLPNLNETQVYGVEHVQSIDILDEIVNLRQEIWLLKMQVANLLAK